MEISNYLCGRPWTGKPLDKFIRDKFFIVLIESNIGKCYIIDISEFILIIGNILET